MAFRFTDAVKQRMGEAFITAMGGEPRLYLLSESGLVLADCRIFSSKAVNRKIAMDVRGEVQYTGSPVSFMIVNQGDEMLCQGSVGPHGDIQLDQYDLKAGQYVDFQSCCLTLS